MTSVNREALTPTTCALARTMVGWTQANLATRSGVTADTVASFESRRHRPRHETVTALLRAFSAAGVVFLLRDGVAECVPLGQSPGGSFARGGLTGSAPP